MPENLLELLQYFTIVFAICLLLGIAYSANIGGFATIIGTPTNLVLIGYLQENLGLQIAFFTMECLCPPYKPPHFFS